MSAYIFNQGPFQTLIGCDYRAQPSTLSFLKNIFIRNGSKWHLFWGLLANKMPFFRQMCPQKTHPCPQSLEQGLLIFSFSSKFTVLFCFFVFFQISLLFYCNDFMNLCVYVLFLNMTSPNSILFYYGITYGIKHS